MKVFRYDERVGKKVEHFGSREMRITPVIKMLDKQVSVFQTGCVYLGPGGRIGGHEAAVPQLFLVVNGEGWVSAADEDRRLVTTGQAVYWAPGEWHEVTTEQGLTAIIMESDQLEPSGFLVEI
ncbi:cupin domain-containing protein [Paenibacillus tarimensis]|uniref:cupin domain-containing protein n=1 Tax=Paenibacillus tarimensis TaxID=416012 RepID=UPI001F2D1AE6|nr:cupin domain-containing protein [Paenibacillus tarimensis]MCF2944623.1 cupin [Paenibacillus tarimensis]